MGISESIERFTLGIKKLIFDISGNISCFKFVFSDIEQHLHALSLLLLLICLCFYI